MLARANARVEDPAAPPLPDRARRKLWVEWLWKSDPEEELQPDVLLNRNHLLGLILCRDLAKLEPPTTVQHAGNDRLRLLDADRAPAAFTLRELRDTLDNLLAEWPAFLARLHANQHAEAHVAAARATVDGAFARLGVLASEAGPPTTFNDTTCTEPSPDHDGLAQLTRAFLRRTLAGFLVLYRHMHLLAICERVPDDHPAAPPALCALLHPHHVEASNDDYHELHMHASLPTAAKLVYRHDFPGMYNHVSQVLYFHNPKYARVPRLPLASFDDPGADPVHVLPALWQLHPDIQVVHEDQRFDATSCRRGWSWLVCAGRVYLVAPDAAVHFHPCARRLIAPFLASK